MVKHSECHSIFLKVVLMRPLLIAVHFKLYLMITKTHDNEMGMKSVFMIANQRFDKALTLN